MADDSIGIATDTDAYLDTVSRTISSQTRHAQRHVAGWSSDPTYVVRASGISTATTADHLLQVMADGTNYSRVLRYRITPTDDIPAAATVLLVTLVRLSTAGTGGSAVTPRGYDPADSAYGGGAQTLPSSKGTEGNALIQHRIPLPAAHPFVSTPAMWTWEASPFGKPIIFGTSTSSGLCWKVDTGIASCTVDVIVEFTTTTYL
jgi:hypothetical protein